MRSVIFGAAGLLLLALSNRAVSAEFRGGEQFVLKADETIADDLYVFGQRITIDGTVQGDLVAFGEQITVNETIALAEVVQACDAIHVGDGLKPFVPEPVPLGRRTGARPANVPVAETELGDDSIILRAKDSLTGLAADTIVFISLGADQGVAPGDIYTVYRRNMQGLPPVVLGELAVLSVHERSSVARILESRYPMYVGDYLEPK